MKIKKPRGHPRGFFMPKIFSHRFPFSRARARTGYVHRVFLHRIRLRIGIGGDRLSQKRSAVREIACGEQICGEREKGFVADPRPSPVNVRVKACRRSESSLDSRFRCFACVFEGVGADPFCYNEENRFCKKGKL